MFDTETVDNVARNLAHFGGFTPQGSHHTKKCWWLQPLDPWAVSYGSNQRKQQKRKIYG